LTTALVQGVLSAAGMSDACSWCGRSGCEPERHPEALADMRADAAGVLPGWELWRDDPRHDEAYP